MPDEKRDPNLAMHDAINVLENSLRDLIEQALRNRFGEAWADQLGVTDRRRAEWEARREEERKKRTAGVIDERLLYYADFTDLFVIMKKNWDSDFRRCFGDQTELRVYLEKLANFRNPEAHSRSLLPVEEQLVAGMTGELRQKITLFLSQGGGSTEPEHFARIEEVIDSFGNRVTGQASGQHIHRTGLTLRPGDRVTLRGRAWDPDGARLKWRLFFAAATRHLDIEGAEFEYGWAITDADIGEDSYVSMTIESPRPYVRYSQHNGDDNVLVIYRVLPKLTQ